MRNILFLDSPIVCPTCGRYSSRVLIDTAVIDERDEELSFIECPCGTILWHGLTSAQDAGCRALVSECGAPNHANERTIRVGE